jgi:hypothetical protein
VLEQSENFLAVWDDVVRKTGIDVSENLFSKSIFISFLICFICNVFVPSPFFNRYRSQYYGTTKRTDLGCSSWTHPQALREGCWVSWLTAVTESISVCCPLLTEYSIVLSFTSVAARFRTWVFGRSFVGNGVSKSAGGIDVFLL